MTWSRPSGDVQHGWTERRGGWKEKFAQKWTWGMDDPFQPGSSAKSPGGGKHRGAPSNVGGEAHGGFSFSGDMQTRGVVHLHLSLLLGSLPGEAASPGRLWKVPQGWRDERLTSSSICFLLQDYIFYLEPDKLESGKGKCSYDPKVDTVSALISEFCRPLGLALAALGRGNVQMIWDNGSHHLPVLPTYPPGVGFLPLPPLQLQTLGHLGCPVLGHLAQQSWGF